jgi:hypothetical protein
MLRSIKDILKHVMLLAPANVTTTTASAGIATNTGGALSFLVNVGAFAFSGTDKLDIVLQERDSANDPWADAGADAFYEGEAENAASGIVKSLDHTDDASKLYQVNYRGSKLYARLNFVETGTVDVPISVTAVQGNLDRMPA